MKSVNWPDHILNFLAVIIGVSMAFYINTYSEDVRLRNERSLIVDSFSEELSRDREVYESYQIAENHKRIGFLDKSINKIITRDTDSLSYYVRRAVPFTNYAPQAVTFNSTSASGKFDLLNDYEVRMRLAGYYTVTAKEAEFRGLGQVDFYTETILPWLISNTNFVAEDASALLDTEFLNMLLIYRDLVKNKVAQYERLVESSLLLESKLDSLKVDLE